MKEKTLRHPRSTAVVGDSHQGSVNLYGFAAWLKGEPMVCSYLSPAAARKLAIELLQAAERAES